MLAVCCHLTLRLIQLLPEVLCSLVGDREVRADTCESKHKNREKGAEENCERALVANGASLLLISGG